MFFEKEGIWTFDGKGELLLTIMSSLAQEESRAISENVTWGVRKRFSDGQVMLPYKQFLGYARGDDGLPAIIEEEAKIVRRIFRQYMEGKTPSAIARALEKDGILSPGGSKTWQAATVRSILTNEKYKGDALLQKRFTSDFLTKTLKPNEGEVPQYYVRNSHPAIVCPAEWDAVQAEMARRKKLGRPYTCDSAFSTRIVCGDCGGFYGPKVWNSNRPNRKEIWQCNEKYKRRGIPGNGCRTPHVMRADLKSRFLAAFNELTGDREELLDNCRLACETLYDCAELDREIDALGREQEAVAEHARRVIRAGAHTETEEDDQSGDLLRRYDEITQRLTVLEAERCRRAEKERVVRQFIRDIEERPLAIDTFDEQLWLAVVDRVMVNRDGGMLFLFRDGSAVEVDGEATRQKHTI